jgi:hypothetical protein
MSKVKSKQELLALLESAEVVATRLFISNWSPGQKDVHALCVECVESAAEFVGAVKSFRAQMLNEHGKKETVVEAKPVAPDWGAKNWQVAAPGIECKADAKDARVWVFQELGWPSVLALDEASARVTAMEWMEAERQKGKEAK